jgi:hypothetical protein
MFFEELRSLGVAFLSLAECIDVTTPAGKLQMHILGARPDEAEATPVPRDGQINVDRLAVRHAAHWESLTFSTRRCVGGRSRRAYLTGAPIHHVMSFVSITPAFRWP